MTRVMSLKKQTKNITPPLATPGEGLPRVWQPIQGRLGSSVPVPKCAKEAPEYTMSCDTQKCARGFRTIQPPITICFKTQKTFLMAATRTCCELACCSKPNESFARLHLVAVVFLRQVTLVTLLLIFRFCPY